MNQPPFDVRFQCPANIFISGPSNSGKTHFVNKLLKNSDELMTKKIKFVLIYYQHWQKTYDDIKKMFKNIKFIQGAPANLEQVTDELKQFAKNDFKVCVFDDMLSHINNFMDELYTTVSHHENCSMIFLTQSIFGKNLRTISINSHYMIVFKSPRDSLQFATVARQIEPSNSKALKSIFLDATERPHGYLILNFTQAQHKLCRYLTNLFPDEWPIKIYSI